MAVLLVLYLLCGRAVGMDRAHFIELNKQARQLARKQEWKALREKLAEIGHELPGVTPVFALRMASVEAHLGDTAAAISWMRHYAEMGLTYDISTDPDLKPLLNEPAWRPVAERLKQNSTPLNRAERVCALDVADLMPEDLTTGGPTGTLILSSVTRHGLFSVSLPKAPGLPCRPQAIAMAFDAKRWPALAVSYDSQRKLLWMTSSAMPGFTGLPKPDDGKAALLAIDPERGTIVARFDLDSGAPGVLGDMSVAPDGAVYVTDSLGGGVYRVRGELRKTALEKIADGLFSPQTPVLARDRKRLFVAEYSMGIAVIELKSGQISYLRHPDKIAVSGLDGLLLIGNSLIGVQNGTDPARIMLYTLNPAQTEIVSAEVIAQGPELGEPTHAVSANGWIYVTVNVGWDKIDDHGELKPGDSFTPPVLLRFRLPLD